MHCTSQHVCLVLFSASCVLACAWSGLLAMTAGTGALQGWHGSPALHCTVLDRWSADHISADTRPLMGIRLMVTEGLMASTRVLLASTSTVSPRGSHLLLFGSISGVLIQEFPLVLAQPCSQTCFQHSRLLLTTTTGPLVLQVAQTYTGLRRVVLLEPYCHVVLFHGTLGMASPSAPTSPHAACRNSALLPAAGLPASC